MNKELADVPLKVTPVFRAGFRSILVMGADKRFLIPLAIVIALFVLIYEFRITVDVICVFLWYFGLKVFQAIARKDENFYDVFSRARKYKWKYPALAYGGKSCSSDTRIRYKKSWS